MLNRLRANRLQARFVAWLSVAALITSGSAGVAGSLSKRFIEKPIAAKNADGHLELFKVDADGELQHRWQSVTTSEWSSWSTLGSACEPGIAIATETNGDLLIFALDSRTHALKFAHQAVPNGQEWSDWKELGSSFISPPVVISDTEQQLEVFAIDSLTHSVKRIRQSAAGWSDWEDLGGNVENGLAVQANRSGRLEVFALATGSHALVHSWQEKPGFGGRWSQWQTLGNTLLPTIVACSNVLGRIEVFGISATSHHVQRICQQKQGQGRSAWSEWIDFGLETKDGLVLGQTEDHRLEIMAVSASDSQLMHRWEILPDGSDKWSIWGSLGFATEVAPAVVVNEDGDLEVFAVDPKEPDALNHRRQISHSSGWLDWTRLEHPTFQYSSRTWQTDEGLPHNNVQAIAQGRDNYLWIGTRAGLARFDGLAFTRFESPNAPELAKASITSLCADHKGALWIGTAGRGVFRMLNGQCTRFTTTNGLAGNNINAVYERRDGSIWFGTSHGLTRFTKGEFTTFTRTNGLWSNFVRSLYEDVDGDLWIATGEGLNRLRGTHMDAFAMPQGLPNDSVRSICQDRGGRIWIGSNNGMLWYGAYWQKFFAYNTRFGLSDPFVSAICEDREGNLWVGTYSGLNRFREGRFMNQLDNQGVPFDHVNVLFEDRENNLWVGSREGLIRLTPKRFTTITKRQGLSHNNVMAVVEHRGGSLWVGTWGGGICAIKDGRATPFASSTNLSQMLVLSLAESRDGALWIGADFDGGLTRLDKNSLTHFSFTNGLPKAPIRALHEDRNGTLWIGTDQGLASFKDGAFRRFSAKDGVSTNAIHAIMEDPDGTVWLGTDAGLVRMRDTNFVTFTVKDGLSDNTVLALYEETNHSLWLGTAKGGLDRLSFPADGNAKPRIVSYNSSRGLFSDEIFGILEDNEGWLWMSCSKGVFRVKKRDFFALDHGNRDSLVSLVYGRSDGMESQQCNGSGQPAVLKTANGHLCFCTSKGLATVDPETVTVNLAPPTVRIEQILVDKRPVLPFSAALEHQDNIPPEAKLWEAESDFGVVRIPPGRGELEFHYTALSFQSPEETRFKYRLEGVDSDWVDAGTRRTAHYNNVPPGRHVFRVMAANKDGAWNERGAALAFELEPHFWETWWCRGAVILALIGFATGTGRYLTKRRMGRKLALLEQRNAIEKERGRIAKDIHDDLGSSLTRIMMLGERAEEDLQVKRDIEPHIDKIVLTARHTVRALDEIVWAVNPENDTLDGLVQYISHYADEFFENSDVSCRLDIPTHLPGLPLSAEFRHDLFLIVKEAFHNVLKHSGATHVRVQVKVNDMELELSLQDDGRGFLMSALTQGRKGNGLTNMRRRAEAIEGRIQFTSAPGEGTAISIRVPLPSQPYVHTIGSVTHRG